jgi:roundabout, axon guidance receptor 2
MSIVKPFISSEPKDVTVHTGQTAEFECKVGGDPKPNIYWERDGNKMPFGRAQILDNKSLRIINVIAQDEGLYVCNAENDVGSEKAKASLTVHCKYLPSYHIDKLSFNLLIMLRRHSFEKHEKCDKA